MTLDKKSGHNWKATGKEELTNEAHKNLACWIEYECTKCKLKFRDYYHVREFNNTPCEKDLLKDILKIYVTKNENRWGFGLCS